MVGCLTLESRTCTSELTFVDLTPGQKICGIFELLEKILLQSSMNDLLFAQKVNKTWQQTIQRSTKLQRALCLQTAKSKKHAKKASHQTATSSAMRIAKLNDDSPETEWTMLEPPEQTDATLARKLYHYSGKKSKSGLVNPFHTKVFTTVYYDDEESFKFNPSAARFGSMGSWSKMYLSQPSLTKVVVQSTAQTIGHMVADDLGEGSKVYGSGMLIEKTTGVTMGDLHQALKKVNALCEAMVEEYPDKALEWAGRGDYYEDKDEGENDDDEDDEDGKGGHIYCFNLLVSED